MSVGIDVRVTDGGLRNLRRGLSGSELKGLHGRIAKDLKTLVVNHVATDDSHVSANRLGARPTGHMEKAAKRIEAVGEDARAVIKIPRKSRLRAAFGDYTLTPKAGKTYLTIPAHPLTYGRSVRSFPEETFKFAILRAHRHFPVLLFRKGGEVAYWLRKNVEIKEDRTLLPFDEIPVAAARVASEYVRELCQGGVA